MVFISQFDSSKAGHRLPKAGRLRRRAIRNQRTATRLTVERMEERTLMSTFWVTNTYDSGDGSLRQAIDASNNDTANSAADTIDFAISGAGVHTIQPLTVLPAIKHPVFIDGYSQGKYSAPDVLITNPTDDARLNTLAVGDNAVLKIVLDGSAIAAVPLPSPGIVQGLLLQTHDSEVSGLVFSNWNGVAVNTFGSYIFNDVIAGNFIGTDAAGTKAQPNEFGVFLQYGAHSNRVGLDPANPNVADRNVISGQAQAGVAIIFAGTTLNSVSGNLIGTDATGLGPLGNGLEGVGIGWGAQGNQVGGAGLLANTIAFNRGPGVWVVSADSTGNRIEGNSIYDNGGLGIDLGGDYDLIHLKSVPGPDGVTPNDSQGHSGPNGFQNFPVITTAVGSASTFVAGTLSSTPGATFTLDFYANPAPDGSGYGQGQRWLGSATVTTDATGNVSFQVPGLAGTAPGQWVSATATAPDGSTSEFSYDIAVDTSQAIIPVVPVTVSSDLQSTVNSVQSSTATTPITNIVLNVDPNTLNSVTGAVQNLQVAVPGSGGISTTSIVIVMNLAAGQYSDTNIAVPANVQLVINGGGGLVRGNSPAFILQRGKVLIENLRFVTATNSPTILVEGGSLTIRNSTIQESTGYAQAAILITGGAVDLGTAANPGGNTINVNGPGEFVHTSTPAAVTAVGDTFAINGVALAASTLSFTIASGPSYAVLLGQPVTFPVTITVPAGSGVPTGTVDVFDTTTGVDLGSVALVNGIASESTAALPVGTQALTLFYTGDKHFVASRTTLTVNVIPPASLSGVVFADFNDDGQVDFGEKGIPGVPITLTGTDDLGYAVNLSQTTDSAGAYIFQNLRPGTYAITETQQPAGYTPGIASVGTGGRTVSGAQFMVSLPVGVNAMNYNYGERPVATGAIQHGQTAGIGFWNNKNGQALIKALNGGVGTQLGDWLAATFPHIFGASSGSNNLARQSNAYVAAFFQSRFVVHGQKLDAQLLATALAVYVTDSTLDSTSVGARYGFTVSGNGLATATYNIGGNGAAFGVADNTTMTVMDLLLGADAQAVNGVLYYGDTTNKRKKANTVFSAINEVGSI